MSISSKLLKELSDKANDGFKPYIESIHAHLERLLEEAVKQTALLQDIKEDLKR
jgi:hypothetical protein